MEKSQSTFGAKNNITLMSEKTVKPFYMMIPNPEEYEKWKSALQLFTTPNRDGFEETTTAPVMWFITCVSL